MCSDCRKVRNILLVKRWWFYYVAWLRNSWQLTVLSMHPRKNFKDTPKTSMSEEIVKESQTILAKPTVSIPIVLIIFMIRNVLVNEVNRVKNKKLRWRAIRMKKIWRKSGREQKNRKCESLDDPLSRLNWIFIFSNGSRKESEKVIEQRLKTANYR